MDELCFLLNIFQKDKKLPNLTLLAYRVSDGSKFEITVDNYEFRYFIRMQDLEYVKLITDLPRHNFSDSWSLMQEQLVTFEFDEAKSFYRIRETLKNNGIKMFQSDVKHPLSFKLFKNLKHWFYFDDRFENSHEAITAILDKDIDYSLMKIPETYLVFDLEVDIFEKVGDLTKIEGKYPIISIAFIDELSGDAHFWYCHKDEDLKGFNHSVYGKRIVPKKYYNERKMLEDFLYLIGEHIFSISYNKSFDIGYLVKRSAELLLDAMTIENLAYTQHLDMMVIFANKLKFSDYVKLKLTIKYIHWFKQEKIKLLPECLRNIESGSKAKKYLDFRQNQSGAGVMKMSLKELAFYNASDVFDTAALMDATSFKTIPELWEMLGLIKVDNAFIHTDKLDPAAMFFLNLNGVRAPDFGTRLSKEEKAEIRKNTQGGFAWDAANGKVWEDTAKIDFSRYYSGIIQGENLSPERFADENFKPFMTIRPDGSTAEEPFMFLTEFARYLADNRNISEDNVKATEDPVIKAKWKSRASVEKTMNSGLWGYIATESCRFHRIEIKSKILEMSRHFIQKFGEFFESEGYKVLGGFTDSIDIKVPHDVKPSKLNKIGNEFLLEECDRLGYIKPIQGKVEIISKKAIYHARLNYAQLVIWYEGMGDDERLEKGELMVKGMAVIRSDHSLLGRELQREMMMIIFENDEYYEMCQEAYISYFEQINKILEGKTETLLFEHIAVPIKLRDPLESYSATVDEKGNAKRPSPRRYYAESSLQWNKIATAETQISQGDKPFCLPMLKDRVYSPKENVKITRWLAFMDHAQINWKFALNHINKEALLDRILRKKALTILQNIGVTREKLTEWETGLVQTDINEWF